MPNWIIRFILWLFAGPKKREKEVMPEPSDKLIYEVSIEIAQQVVLRKKRLISVEALDYNYEDLSSVMGISPENKIYITPNIVEDINQSGLSIADYVELRICHEIAFMEIEELEATATRIDAIAKKRLMLRRADLIIDHALKERNLTVYLETKARDAALRLLQPSLHTHLVDLVESKIKKADEELDLIVDRYSA